MPLAGLLPHFQSLPPLPTNELCPSSADSQVGGFAYLLRPCGFLQGTHLWDQEFLPLPQSPQVFIVARGSEALFLLAGTLDGMVSLPSCSSQFICTQMWDHLARLPGLPAAALLDILSAPAASLFLLPVWMNVSSLTPWLLSFHTVQFSGSSGWFYFFQICVVLLSVVRGSKVYLPTLPTLPSRPEVLITVILMLIYEKR